MGNTFAGALGYADDIALITPMIYRLKEMIKICENFALHYSIQINASHHHIVSSNHLLPLLDAFFSSIIEL